MYMEIMAYTEITGGLLQVDTRTWQGLNLLGLQPAETAISRSGFGLIRD